MIVYIQILKSSREVREALNENGWHIEELGNETLAVTHSRVVNEDSARKRLFHLGLLTSSRLRIDFETEIAKRGTSIHKSHTQSPRFLHKTAVS